MSDYYNPYLNCGIGVISHHSLAHSAYLTAERMKAMQNIFKTPAQRKLIAAQLVASEVRARRPEMQVKKLQQPQD